MVEQAHQNPRLLLVAIEKIYVALGNALLNRELLARFSVLRLVYLALGSLAKHLTELILCKQSSPASHLHLLHLFLWLFSLLVVVRLD